jgi:hypothetical protein
MGRSNGSSHQLDAALGPLFLKIYREAVRPLICFRATRGSRPCDAPLRVASCPGHGNHITTSQQSSRDACWLPCARTPCDVVELQDLVDRQLQLARFYRAPDVLADLFEDLAERAAARPPDFRNAPGQKCVRLLAILVCNIVYRSDGPTWKISKRSHAEIREIRGHSSDASPSFWESDVDGQGESDEGFSIGWRDHFLYDLGQRRSQVRSRSQLRSSEQLGRMFHLWRWLWDLSVGLPQRGKL